MKTFLTSLLIVSFLCGVAVASNSPRKAASQYLRLWQSGDYAAMYAMLSPSAKRSTTLVEFVGNLHSFRERYIIKAYRLAEIVTQGVHATAYYELDLTRVGGSRTQKGQLRLLYGEGKWHIEG